MYRRELPVIFSEVITLGLLFKRPEPKVTPKSTLDLLEAC